jgi:multidrug efflux system membrane fusion protein
MNTRWLGLGLLGALLLLAGNVLHGQDDPRIKKPLDPPDAPREKRVVQVSQPVAREIADYEDFTGRVEAVQSVDLRARVTGYLVKVSFKPGTTVKAGDLLFEIDPRPYQAALDAANAELARAEAHLKLATANLERAKALLKNATISQEDYNKIVGDLEEAQAAVKAAQANREIHKLNLDYTHVTAPISGKIGLPLLTEGNLVVADKTLLAKIVSTDPVHVYFDVDERTHLRLARLKGKAEQYMDLPVQMRLSDEDGFPHRGKVDFVDMQVNPTTGTIRWRAVFANPDDLLKPGLFARVRLTTSAPHKALLVPDQAVLNDQGKRYLFLVNDKNMIERRLVKVGSLHGELRAVTEGLTADDWVVVKVETGLTPGDTVTPKKVEMPKDDK